MATENKSTIVVNTTGSIEIGESRNRTHHFIGYEFQDINGDPATPGAGTITVTAKTMSSPNTAIPVLYGTDIDATGSMQPLSINDNVTEVVVTTDSITTAVQVLVIVTSNEN